MKKLVLLACVALLCGCSTYTTPGAGVSLAAISENDGDIAAAFQREPAITFPARLAVARVAAPGYRSGSNNSVGTGAFGIVTTRDIETDESFARLGAMPQVLAVAPVSRLLVPANLGTTRDLRAAAAQLRADALLVYTIDTRFRTESADVGPLQTIALGFLPTRKAVVNATCAFMVIDVRTGFVYGTGETTATEDQRSNLWGSEQAIEAARLRAERRAFEDGLGEVARLWTSILQQHAGARPAG
ncbi:hypothetical protein GGQ87_000563 [Brevundimonas alba]|uniref:Lipoprotein n=1 Tax=Brevundimonas alba TaxID=74314 RepID=A0A7X5YHY3_9CAUL|nr:hypothetical protein [Brevundimonas alba]NJC40305.1 hypothetical protein [Brevundimonas alba]